MFLNENLNSYSTSTYYKQRCAFDHHFASQVSFSNCLIWYCKVTPIYCRHVQSTLLQYVLTLLSLHPLLLTFLIYRGQQRQLLTNVFVHLGVKSYTHHTHTFMFLCNRKQVLQLYRCGKCITCSILELRTETPQKTKQPIAKRHMAKKKVLVKITKSKIKTPLNHLVGFSWSKRKNTCRKY